jgi:molecular chaperone GrpE
MAGYPGEPGQPEHPGQPARPGQQDEEDGAQHQGPVIRDKRRIDPETGELRQPAQPAATDPTTDPTIPDDLSGLEELAGLAPADRGGDAALAAERLADLQRLQAEYVNYRKRVERDRDVARDQAVGAVLESLLPVLDDIHLARQHGDLDGGPFAAIADKLDAVLTRYGLQRFGEAGEPFDPAVHEALMHTQADLGEGVDVTTVTQVLQPGYRQGDRVLRAARVAVADPE